ncbi:MAG: hypothetical protein ACXACD_16500 [Candidatus Thorarchaeota archaeon]|jgi:hypothetical protein
MVRITTISNILSGIGIAILAFSAILKYLLEGLGQTGTAYPFYAWIIGAGLLVIVILASAVNTFTERTGFVHPEDKLVSNMFVFLMAIATILILGILDEGLAYQRNLFDMGAMIVIAYIFLFIFVFFSGEITEAGEMGQVKEMTARFMLVSLLLGAIMAGVKVGLDIIWDTTGSYEWAAGALGLFALALVVLIVAFLGRRYEPVGTE